MSFYILNFASYWIVLTSNRWNELAVGVLIKDYKGFNFEKDFPSAFRYVTNSDLVVVLLLTSIVVKVALCAHQTPQRCWSNR